jgi:hypothetical protein
MFKQTLITALILTTCCGISVSVFGQQPVIIKLDNPSFEGYAKAALIPHGWFDCGFAGESPPDTQPSGIFGVEKEAFHGNTYLGLVVRDNDTWEAVGQKLKTKLIKDSTYSFSLYACRSQRYESKSQRTGRDASYTTPIIVRIWGGDGFCAKLDLLSESKPVSSTDWQKLDFILKPKRNSGHFVIEAYYPTNKFPQIINGNILIDNASAIVPILDKN